MSKFFRGESSDSESEEESSSEEDVPQQKVVPSRFQDDSSSGDDTPVKRVARSQLDKLNLEYEGLVTKIKMHIKQNDASQFQADLEKLDKALQKSSQKEQQAPRIYFKALALLEDAVNYITEKGVKLPPVHQKAFNMFKTKFKKHNVPHTKQIAEYRANPDKEEESEESDDDMLSGSDDESSEEEVVAKPAKKAAAKAAPAAAPAPAPAAGAKYGKSFFMKKAGEESSSSDDDEDKDLDESESDESESEDEGDRSKKWKISATKKKEETPEPVRRAQGDKPDKKKQKAKEAEKPTQEETEKQLSPEQVDRKLAEILAARGKRGTDKVEQIEQIEGLIRYAEGDAQRLSLYMHLVSAQFDASPSVATHMPANLWKGALVNMAKIVKVLNINPTLILAETEDQQEQREGEDAPPIVVGNLLGYVERLDDEFIKGLQNIDDPHTHEYVQRLQDEQGLLDLIESVQNYYTRSKDLRKAARAAARRMEHLYYKSDREVAALAKSAAAKATASTAPQPNGTAAPAESTPATSESAPATESTPATSEPAPAASESTPAASETTTTPSEPAQIEPVNSAHSQLIHELAVLIYAHGDERLRTRAVLMHIYHIALHDRFYEARDMMLMSHLQESIFQADVPTQILFNRAMVQLGLCAFRSNLIWEAHSCLSEICGVSRVKELLAQGVTTRFQDKNIEQEKIEKKRQVPFHMHINLELLEVVHLISAMLLEVPNMAANPFDAKRKVISRNFRRLMDYFDRQVFTGPPENNRDFVAAAAKALAAGNWKTTETLLFSVKIWSLMPNAELVKANIRKRIQEEGLRTYLFSYASVYDSINIADLCQMFELSQNHVHGLVSKMMINEELKASWDQPTGSIVMHKAEPSKLQHLALAFAEKAAVFVENNERMLDQKTGGGYFKEGGKGQGQGQQKDRNWQEGGGYGRQNYNQNYQRKPYNKDQQRGERGEGRQGGQKGDGYSTFQSGGRQPRHGEQYHRNK